MRIAMSPHAKKKTPVRRKRRPPSGSAMLSNLAWQEIARSLRLSERQLQIVCATFDGRKDTAIAADLGITRHTVHTHVERLHHKLAVADRAQLVVRVIAEFVTLTLLPQSKLPPICATRAAGRCPLRD